MGQVLDFRIKQDDLLRNMERGEEALGEFRRSLNGFEERLNGLEMLARLKEGQ